MNSITQLFLVQHGLTKLYDRYMDIIGGDYGLSRIEITIISFLYNNPELDTGADICEYRMLSKGNVSQGVEALMKKGYLIRIPDTKDRRKIHLRLTSKADGIVAQIEEVKASFHTRLKEGVSSEELEIYLKTTDKLIHNIRKEFERKESLHES